MYIVKCYGSLFLCEAIRDFDVGTGMIELCGVLVLDLDDPDLMPWEVASWGGENVSSTYPCVSMSVHSALSCIAKIGSLTIDSWSEAYDRMWNECSRALVEDDE
jgi:hypothetical protein